MGVGTSTGPEVSFRPCFIVSTGRCGSTMLARVLALHPELGVFHEPKPLLNTESYLRWSGRRDTRFARRRLKGKRDDLIEQVETNGLVFVESSLFLAHLIPELEGLYRPKFVHLFRDGRDFTRSGLEMGWYDESGMAAPVQYAKILVKRWMRRNYLLPMGAEWSDRWEDHRLSPPRSLRDRFERTAWLWAEVNGEILNHLDQVPKGRRRSIRVEEFDGDSLRMLIEFLGVTMDDTLMEPMMAVANQRPNQTEDPKVPAVDDWTEEELARFEAIAGSMMERLGYEST